MSVNYHVFSSIHTSLLLGNPPIWSCVDYTEDKAELTKEHECDHNMSDIVIDLFGATVHIGPEEPTR